MYSCNAYCCCIHNVSYKFSLLYIKHKIFSKSHKNAHVAFKIVTLENVIYNIENLSLSLLIKVKYEKEHTHEVSFVSEKFAYQRLG